MGQTFGEKMNRFNVMYTGLNNHQAELSGRGATEEFLTRYKNAMGNCDTTNIDQEAAKSHQKLKTASHNDAMKEMENIYREGAKIVKLGIQQEGWLEFGLTAKR